jgi:F-type H+-transporting ATPase subunit O
MEEKLHWQNSFCHNTHSIVGPVGRWRFPAGDRIGKLYLCIQNSYLSCSPFLYFRMFSAFSRSSSAIRRVAVRSFSDVSHKPPLNLYGINARYANATYSAASKAGLLEKVEGELTALAQTAKNSKAFAGFLENPLIPRNAKSASIGKLMTEAKVSQITVNLCTTLAGNAKLAELPKVAATYMQLMKAKRGQVDATIISAHELSKKQTDQIAVAIKASSKNATDVIISSKIDPSIIGGIQVQIGDKFLDLSIKSRIEEVSRTPL